MSEATLTKIQVDCAKMEAELAIYKNLQPLSTSCESIIDHISNQRDPFSAIPKGENPNPWHASGGRGGSCVVS